jgi:hypothetical protein
MAYMPITGYEVQYCQMTIVNAATFLLNANGSFVNCVAGATTVTIPFASTSLSLGAQLPLAGNRYVYSIKAKNLAGLSTTAKFGSSR